MSTSAVMPSMFKPFDFVVQTPIFSVSASSFSRHIAQAHHKRRIIRDSPCLARVAGECFARARIELRVCEALLQPSAGSGGEARGDAISGGGRQQGHCASQVGQSHLGQRCCVHGTNWWSTHAHLREP